MYRYQNVCGSLSPCVGVHVCGFGCVRVQQPMAGKGSFWELCSVNEANRNREKQAKRLCFVG